MDITIRDIELASDGSTAVGDVLATGKARNACVLTAGPIGRSFTPTPLDAMLPEPFAPAAAVAMAGDPRRPIAWAAARAGRLELLACDADAPVEAARDACRALVGHAKRRWGVFRVSMEARDGEARAVIGDAGFEEVARTGGGRGCGGPGGGSSPVAHLMLSNGVMAEIRSGTWANVARPENAAVQGIVRRAMRLLASGPALSASDERAMLGEVLGSFGEHSTINPGAHIDYGCNLFIGDGCFFNFGCTFLDSAPIVFGEGAMCGPNCTFATPLHPLAADERRAHPDPATGAMGAWERALPISVGRDAWLASNVMVNPGVRIGEGAVIGSGSVVTKDIPAHVLAYGNPCRVVREVTAADRVGI